MARPWVQLGRGSFERKPRNNHVNTENHLPEQIKRSQRFPWTKVDVALGPDYRITRAILSGLLTRK